MNPEPYQTGKPRRVSRAAGSRLLEEQFLAELENRRKRLDYWLKVLEAEIGRQRKQKHAPARFRRPRRPHGPAPA